MRLKARKRTPNQTSIADNSIIEALTESESIFTKTDPINNANEDNMLILEILIDDLNTDFKNILSTNNCLKTNIQGFSRKKEILSNFIKTGYNYDDEILNEHSKEIVN